MPTTRSWIAALAVLALSAVGTAQAAERLSVMYTASAPFAVAWVAKDQGFFAKRGLDVDFTLAANGSVIISGIQSGSVQVGTPSVTVFLQAVDNGLDQVALASTNTFPDPSKAGLAARPDIDIRSPRDLVGKTVGVPGLGGFLDVVLRKWIADAGVDSRTVRFVEITLPQTADALRARQVDAVASVDPFLSRAIVSGAAISAGDYTTSLPAGTIAAVYSASRAWTSAHPDAAASFRAGLDDALAFMRVPGNEGAVRASIARYTKLPPDVIATLVLPNFTTAVSAEQLGFWVDLARKQGLVSNPIDAGAALFSPRAP